jgi:hypothetical protein
MCLPVPWTEDKKESYVDIDLCAKYSAGSEIMEYRHINNYFSIKSRKSINLVSPKAANCPPNTNDRFLQTFISNECVFASRNFDKE